MSEWVVKESKPLSFLEMKNNAGIIVDTLVPEGWTMQAVCGMLGNMQPESTINPGRWESDKVGNLSGGFGLTQWTPATKVRNWIYKTYGSTDYTNGNFQLSRIVYEFANGIQFAPTKEFPMTGTEFTMSTLSAERLAEIFMINYERPLDQSESARAIRRKYAAAWWKEFGGMTVHKLPVWLMMKMANEWRNKYYG